MSCLGPIVIANAQTNSQGCSISMFRVNSQGSFFTGCPTLRSLFSNQSKEEFSTKYFDNFLETYKAANIIWWQMCLEKSFDQHASGLGHFRCLWPSRSLIRSCKEQFYPKFMLCWFRAHLLAEKDWLANQNAWNKQSHRRPVQFSKKDANTTQAKHFLVLKILFKRNKLVPCGVSYKM